jgi:hypothetical protein
MYHTTKIWVKTFQAKIKSDKSKVEALGENGTRKVEKGWYNFFNHTLRMALKSYGGHK